MKTKTFKIMIAAIVVCGAMLFTACTKEDNPGGTGSSGIAMIVKDGQIDYWRQIETAFRDACQEKGLEAYYYATSAEKAYEEQLAAVEAVVTNAKQGEMVPTFYMTESNLHDAVVQPFLKFYYKQVYDTIDGITYLLSYTKRTAEVTGPLRWASTYCQSPRRNRASPLPPRRIGQKNDLI